MADRQGEAEIVAVIVAAIEKHARGDVERLARGIVVELYRAGSRSANEKSRLRVAGCADRVARASTPHASDRRQADHPQESLATGAV